MSLIAFSEKSYSDCTAYLLVDKGVNERYSHLHKNGNRSHSYVLINGEYPPSVVNVKIYPYPDAFPLAVAHSL